MLARFHNWKYNTFMSETYRGQYVLAEVGPDAKGAIEMDIQRQGMDSFIADAEHRLRAQNLGLYSLMAQFMFDRGFTDEQITAARESMVLTHELLRREAEAFVLRMSV
jgi:hypothetical protein